jgi:hypothetical protein
MPRSEPNPRSPLMSFLRAQDGVATVDWVIVCATATMAGFLALTLGQSGLGTYSANVRDEVQAPYFETSWTQNVPIPDPEDWDPMAPITPQIEGIDPGGNLGGHFDPAGLDDRPEDADENNDNDDGSDDSGYGNDPNAPTNGGSGGTGGGGGGTPATTQSNIVIENASFEATGHGNGGWSSGVPGWTIQKGGSGDVGDFNPTSNALDGSTVTGNNVAYLYHGGGSSSFASMSQTFSTTYNAGSTYTFSADIGDGAYAFSGNEPYVVNIYAGNTLIGTTSGTTGDINALQTVTVTSTVNDTSLNGQAIRFEIMHPSSDGGDLLVDNVRGSVSTPVGSGPQVVTTPIIGCPVPDYIAPPHTTTGNTLADQAYFVDTAGGGQTQIQGCAGLPGRGFFNANPAITLNLSDMASNPDFRDFEVRLDSSCDTTLLIRDAQGNWHYDDDSGPGLNSRLRLSNLADLNGQVSIWVGTFGSTPCADVEVRVRVREW